MNDTAIAPSTERQAFYDRIGEHSLAPLWERLHSMVTRAAGDARAAGEVGLRRSGAAVPDAGRRADHREGSGAPRADPGEPGTARADLDHAFAVRRPATDHAGRGGAGAPAFAVGAALHHRGPRRLHRGRRRAHDDGAGRLRHHAELDLARPRQRHRPADGLARRAGHSDRAAVRRQLRRARECRQPDGDAARGRQPGALWRQHAAGRLASDGEELAGVQLSLCALARGAGDAGAQRRSGCLPRPQAALRQPGVRRVGDADDRRVHAVAAGGFRRRRRIARPTARCSSRSKAKARR